MTATLDNPRMPLRSPAAARAGWGPRALEIAAVIASPLILYVVLRIRGMAPPQLPDPTMHTTFIIDPHAILDRYSAMYEPTARLREAARVGFLVPARVSYLLFGALPGFFVFRYVLALIAIGPLYVLLRRMYGRWAGFLGIAVVMSSPVVLTAWGTDYPDSAAVSYLMGALSALALAWQDVRWKMGWLVAGGCLMTLAVWSIGAAVPLVIVLVVVYLGMRLWRERADLWRDVAVLAACAVVVTGALAVCSAVLIGQFNFISPTIRSARVLSQASEVRKNHSSSWSWAPYDAYLLVPPAVVLAFVVLFARRWRELDTRVLFIGLAGTLELAAFVYMQFFSNFQALEMHYFSSTLWSSVNVLLAVTLAEIGRPFVRRGGAGLLRSGSLAVPAALVLAVALAYELAYKAGDYVPGMRWTASGVILVAVLIAAAILGRITASRSSRADGRVASEALRLLAAGGAILVVTGVALVLTVAQHEVHAPLAGTVFDPPPPYANALGGNDTIWRSEYTASTALPGFAGPPAYKGEVMLTWDPPPQYGALQEPMGMYHNAASWVSMSFPVLNAAGRQKIERYQAAQVLLISLTGDSFDRAVRSLAPFDPVVVRRAVLGDASYPLHVWLIDLRRNLRSSAS